MILDIGRAQVVSGSGRARLRRDVSVRRTFLKVIYDQHGTIGKTLGGAKALHLKFLRIG